MVYLLEFNVLLEKHKNKKKFLKYYFHWSECQETFNYTWKLFLSVKIYTIKVKKIVFITFARQLERNQQTAID